MKNLTSLLLITVVACSPGNKEISKQDSTTLVNSNKATGVSSDSTDLTLMFVKAKMKIVRSPDTYYEVSFTSSENEATSRVKWLFDKELSPRYVREIWSVTGAEGNTEYVIQNDEVICAKESEGNVIKMWCEGYQGTKTITDDAGFPSSEEPLPKEYGGLCSADFREKLDVLLIILKEGDIKEESELSYLIAAKFNEHAGEDVTESIEMRIPKVIYTVLIADTASVGD